MAARTVRQDLTESFGMTDDQVDAIALIASSRQLGGKIRAIKELRWSTHQDLRSAKVMIEQLLAEEGLDG